MAEGTVRTADGEDQARYLRSLDDRIAALERETITIPDAQEPCCVCDSFSLYGAGQTFTSCDPIGTHVFDVSMGSVEWLVGSPTATGGGVMLGADGVWIITAHVTVSMTADPTNKARMELVGSNGNTWAMDDDNGNVGSMQLGGSALVHAVDAGLTLTLRVTVETPSVSATIEASSLSDHNTRLQGFLYCGAHSTPLPDPVTGPT